MWSKEFGPVAAVRRSALLLRRSWGENLIGNGGISLAMGFAVIPICVIGFGGGSWALQHGQEAFAIALYAFSVIGILATLLVGSALSAVYTASLYCYAALDEPPAGFDQALIREAFVDRKRSSNL